jgi:hypothetical protein
VGVRDIFRTDIALLHAPSVYDFRVQPVMHGPIADAVPSTNEFGMYPIGLTSIAAYLSANHYNVRIVNLAYPMLAGKNFDAESRLARLRPRLFGIDLHWLPHAQGTLAIAELVERLHPDIPRADGRPFRHRHPGPAASGRDGHRRLLRPSDHPVRRRPEAAVLHRAVAQALNQLKRDRGLIDDATYQTVSGHLRRARKTVALIDDALALPASGQAAALAAIHQGIKEDNEASLLGADELKWPNAGRLIMRPRLAARLALALWAEVRHSWHRLAGTYDTQIYDGTRLPPA